MKENKPNQFYQNRDIRLYKTNAYAFYITNDFFREVSQVHKRRSLWDDNHSPPVATKAGCREQGDLIEQEICGVFRIDPSKNPFAPVWEAEGCLGPITGTLSIYYERGGCEEIDVIIDYWDETNFVVPLGNTRTRTFECVCRIAIEARDRSKHGKETGSVHYKPCHKKPPMCVGRYCLKIYYYTDKKGC